MGDEQRESRRRRLDRRSVDRALVGVQVTNVGSDMGSITPMLGEIQWRTALLRSRTASTAGPAKREIPRASWRPASRTCETLGACSSYEAPQVIDLAGERRFGS